MKKLIYLIFSAVLMTTLAEEVPNITETDCDNKSVSTFKALEGNKPLLVIASGYDCSICRSEAPSYATLADSLVGRVSVWGAMNYRFSNTRVPTCTELESWKSTYDWDNFFIFNDNNNGTNKTWAQSGYTSYTVVNPISKEYAYRGTSESRALDSLFAILERAERVTSTKEILQEDASFNFSDGILELDELIDNAILNIYALTGEMIFTQSLEDRSVDLNAVLPKDKILIVSITSDQGVITKKIYL